MYLDCLPWTTKTLSVLVVQGKHSSNERLPWSNNKNVHEWDREEILFVEWETKNGKLCSFFHVGYAVHGVQRWEYLNFDWENYIFVVLSITSGGHEAGLFYAYCGLFLTGFDLRCNLCSTDDLALLKPFKALNKDFSFSVFLQ